MRTLQIRSTAWLLVGLAWLSSACLDRELKPINPCLVSTVSRKVTINSIDRVDLLFMVDNSASMTSKQNSLKAQFPRMIQVLSTGRRSANDPSPFPPVRDMHLAVVSSDMGVIGQPDIMGCDPNGGDDGRLKHASSGDPGCAATYPPFLSYDGTRDNPMQIGVDFACIASLGVEGCTYEHQLEAPLKALWPSMYVDAGGNLIAPNPYSFLNPAQPTGRGSLPPPEGSLGFMRNDPASPSLLGIVLLTDEDDQSSQKTEYLGVTDTSNPIARQGVQVRSLMNPQNLYDVQRYIRGFKQLRPGQEELVVFAAIAGVPLDLVDANARANVDFSDAAQRDAYYDHIADDPRMRQTVINGGVPQLASLSPACRRRNSMGEQEVATPAQRILSVVKGFGENATLQSICADDYGPGMDAIIEIIARQLGAVCLPRPLVRSADGQVACGVVWELPPANKAVPGTPTQCGQLPFLKPVGPGRPAFNALGGMNCEVEQLPVTDNTTVARGDGWFYDTFSSSVMTACPLNRRQRVTFTDAAKPPNGVIVDLECLNEVQSQPSVRTDLNNSAAYQPELGSACATVTTKNGKVLKRDAACVLQLNSGKTDSSMFCHAQLNVCVQGCKSSSDCPPAWECDSRPDTLATSNGKAYCVNPTCGTDL